MEISQKGDEEISIQSKNVLINEKIKVFESHGFEISKLPHSLISIADSKNCKHEIIQYDGKFIFGTQFHPEMTSDGKDLIHKFCFLWLVLITLRIYFIVGIFKSWTFTSFGSRRKYLPTFTN